MKIVLLFLSVLVFAGCSKELKVETKKLEISLPSWYVSPPNNDKKYLYGIGEGKTVLQAQKAGLANLASRLYVSVHSNTSTHKESYRDYREYVKSNVVQSIQTKTLSLEITDVKFLQSKRLNYQSYIVLVQIDKKNIYKKFSLDVKRFYKNVLNKEKHLKKSDILSKLLYYKTIEEKQKEINIKILILENMNLGFKSKKYKVIDNKILNNVEDLQNALGFFVQTKSLWLEKIIKNSLHNENINMHDKMSKNTIMLELKEYHMQTKMYGINLVRSSVSTKLLTSKNKDIGSSHLRFKGASSSNHKMAQYNLEKNLEVRIKNEGIGILFGNKYKVLFGKEQ